MNKVICPISTSHRTFNFGNVVIDSNFDSGNCSDVQKVNATTFNIWIGTDHPKNNYRTWFYFSLMGLSKGTTATFKLKNMQNQQSQDFYMMDLSQFIVRRDRNNGRGSSRRQTHRQLQGLDQVQEFNQGWIQWSFRHTLTSNSKVFFAFFYPWSNEQNDNFLNSIKQRCDKNPEIYFHRCTIAKTLEGRDVDFLTISSKKGIINKQESIEDKYLFIDQTKPKTFNCDKKCIVITARVHPGQVPSSHVMTGIIDSLTQDNILSNILRDKTVFYIIPILNPDGVARGHYRVDTNGINLNRCYINPNPKEHSSIYAVKKFITHLHQNNRYFGYLDLHAHASRKGMFIYGNSTNELQKQVETCLFPKILSLNSENFEYEGSNFTEQNMYGKDRGDHISKQGAGRVAIFKATKNSFSWTLECNYNINRYSNILQEQKRSEQSKIMIHQNQLDQKIIVPYKNTLTKEPNQFYTIETYRQLGKEIIQSFLDLLEANPLSRIQNPANYYKSVQYLKMNLAVALLRMAPNRFQTHYKKIFYCIQSKTNPEMSKRSIQALYLLLIKKVKILNLNQFLRSNIRTSVIFSTEQKNKEKTSFFKRSQSLKSKRSALTRRTIEQAKEQNLKSQRQTTQNEEFNDSKQSMLLKDKHPIGNTADDEKYFKLPESQVHIQSGCGICQDNKLKLQSIGFFSWQNEASKAKKVFLHIEEFKMVGINKMRSSLGAQVKNMRAKGIEEYNFRNSKQPKIKFGPLPLLGNVKTKSSIGVFPTQLQIKQKIDRNSSKNYFEDQQ